MNLQTFLDHPHINHQRHPYLPITIFNYSKVCQYDSTLWDEYTMIARGLILDDCGEVIARPFAKFMNLGQVPETFPENLPREYPLVSEKLDGSMGILYFDGEIPYITTRGSFISEQAQWASAWIQARGLRRDDFLSDHTYLFEIIYPKNRVVLNYGERDELVLLAIIDNTTGRDRTVPYRDPRWVLEDEASLLELPLPQYFQFITIKEMQQEVKTLTGQEGFVLFYPNAGLRVKVKTDEYMRLHKIISGLTEKAIFDIVSKGGDFSHIPDEWYDWANNLKAKYTAAFAEIEEYVFDLAMRIKHIATRKEQALYLKANYPDYMGIVFNLMDKGQATEAIWRMVARDLTKTP